MRRRMSSLMQARPLVVEGFGDARDAGVGVTSSVMTPNSELSSSEGGLEEEMRVQGPR